MRKSGAWTGELREIDGWRNGETYPKALAIGMIGGREREREAEAVLEV